MSKITKLGLGIVTYEGTEHIKNIAYELRNLVDEILVCPQKVSYYGEPMHEEDIKEIEYLKEIGYIDKIIWFDPDLSYLNQGGKMEPEAPRLIECDKRNMIIDELEKDMCSHVLIIDSDEFYDYDQFKKSKEKINNDEEVHITYCQLINYYNSYDRVLVYPSEAHVPFISESKYRFNFNENHIKHTSDQTRRYYIPDEKTNYHVFKRESICMHHFSWIRKDITKKIDSWSSKKYFENVKGLRDAILHRYFTWQEGQNAILMIGTPDYQVPVEVLTERYINPRYQLNEKAIAGEFKN